MATHNVETTWIDLDLWFAKQKRKGIPGQRLWKHSRACLLHRTPQTRAVTALHIPQPSQIRDIPHGKIQKRVTIHENTSCSITNLELNTFPSQACCHGQDCANNRQTLSILGLKSQLLFFWWFRRNRVWWVVKPWTPSLSFHNLLVKFLLEASNWILCCRQATSHVLMTLLLCNIQTTILECIHFGTMWVKNQKAGGIL